MTPPRGEDLELWLTLFGLLEGESLSSIIEIQEVQQSFIPTGTFSHMTPLYPNCFFTRSFFFKTLANQGPNTITPQPISTISTHIHQPATAKNMKSKKRRIFEKLKIDATTHALREKKKNKKGIRKTHHVNKSELIENGSGSDEAVSLP